jgi:hypothetical protein
MDLYTKSVLTVIAGTLVVLCAQNMTKSAQAGAEGAVQKVTICVESDTSASYVCNYGANDRPLKLTH